MSDVTLLIFGCAVTFTAVAGAYVAIRAGYDRGGAEKGNAAVVPTQLSKHRRAGRRRTNVA